MTQVLVVDDDDFFYQIVEQQLGEEGYHCYPASHLNAACAWIKDNGAPDIILLDYDLGPDHETGIEACRTLKSTLKVPIVMLTGDDRVETIVACLDAGADQYLTKPYMLPELLARMRASLRLYYQDSDSHKGEVITAEGLSLDSSSCVLVVDDQSLTLTDMECAAAAMLVRHYGKDVHRDDLCQLLYDRSFDPNNRALDVLIGRLRRKLTAASENYKIRSVRGIGYKLCKSYRSGLQLRRKTRTAAL